MQRDKVQTRKKIIDAVERLFVKSGFQDIGINSIAREAGVDKVLIYRYFGGLPQLLRAYAEEGTYWPSLKELLGGEVKLHRATNVDDLIITLLTNYLRELRRRKNTQEILRWDFLCPNELTAQLDASREKQGAELFAALPVDPSRYPDIDLQAITAMLHAGISNLVLKSKTADKYLGIDLHSNFGWTRLEKAIHQITKGYFARVQTKPAKE
jgi:AcrR family transcriptional regulator